MAAAISLPQVRGLLGATEAHEVAALANALIGADLTSALRALNVAEQGADLRQFARDIQAAALALMLLEGRRPGAARCERR
ncbi:MAG: hypothetical protein U0Z44_21210 [Kouleothrix sp.]